MNVVIVGQVCIDKNVSENASYTAPGGPPVFINKVFSQIPDVKTVTIAPYGKDFLAFNSKFSLFPPFPTSDATLVYENTMKGTLREQKAYYRENAVPISPDKNVEKLLANCDILFVAPLLDNFSPEYIGEIIKYTSKDTLTVLLPQGYYRGFTKGNNMVVQSFSDAEKILPFFKMVIVSEVDGEEDMLTTAEYWSESYGVISIVTLGEKGAVAIQGTQKIYLPTKPVPVEEVVDSIGSGEIFSASIAYAYKKTGSLEKAGKFANAVARARLFYPSNALHITIPAL